ncbi:MAG: glycine cleavage system protein H [Thermoanaerobaculia bacterium]
MIALLVILTFAAAILLDHLLLKQPVIFAEEAPTPEATNPRPRFVPAVIGGFEVPENLRYHPGHTWAAAEGPNLVRVGIDDFAAKLAGDVTRIDIPERGRWIRQGQKMVAMHRNGKEIDLVSPIEGTIVAINEEVIRDPKTARNDPYGEGWLIAVNAPDAKTNFRNLLSGGVARRWMDESAARLRALVNATPGIAMAQDGGVAIDDVLNHVGPDEWEKAAREFFLTA